jgi:hypothetical protein
MVQQLLFIHWKGVRFGLLPLALVAFGLPLLVVQGLGVPPNDPDTLAISARAMLRGIQGWTPLFPLLATLTGVTVALSAWAWDHKKEHVYALSLPVPRWNYILQKMGAGAALLLIPCLAFWMGAVLATSSLDIPLGLRAYPTAVAFRFLLTALLLYALLFAMAAGTLRTTIWILVGFGALLVLGGTAVDWVGEMIVPGFQTLSLMDWLLDRLLSWPGPFEVITGSWMLVDV